MQTQNIRGGVSINLGPFASDYEFIPRIEYLNLILHDATWNLKKNHIEPLLKTINTDKDFLLAIQKFRDTLKIPQFVMLADGDNELLINFNNITSVKMLLNTVSKRPSFKLTEFLFSDEGIVKEGKDYYTNQVIVSFYNEQKLNKAKTNSNA